MSKDADKNTSQERSSEERRQQRVERAEMEAVLARKRCRHCLTVGDWKVEGRNGQARYVRCGGCQRRDQVLMPKPKEPTEPPAAAPPR